MGAARFVAWMGALLAFLLVTPAFGQRSRNRDRARDIAGAAIALYDAKDYEAALSRFLEADKLYPTTTLKLRAAQCLDKLDKLIEAVEKYREVIDTELKRWAPRQHREARDDAKKELAALQDEIPSISVTVGGPGSEGAKVEFEGEPLGDDELGEDRQMNPGSYTLEAHRGLRSVKKTVRLKRGDKLHITLELPAPVFRPTGKKKDDGKVMRVAGWVAVGVGAVGLVMGSVTGGLVLSEEGSLEDRCPDRKCPPSVHSDAGSFETNRMLSTVGFILGGIGAAAGLTLLLLAPPEPKDASRDSDVSLVPYVSPLGLGVLGTF